MKFPISNFQFPKKKYLRAGSIILQTMFFSFIAFMVIVGFTNLAASNIATSRNLEQNEQALQIAEAGIDYYRWHLAHAPEDYKDGSSTSSTGPYIHSFKDKEGNIIGNFALVITPSPTGSTIVTINSTGTVASSSIKRAIRAKLGISSFAKYAVAGNSDLRFGEGTEVFGPIYSNGGIHFDGLAHNLVGSALTSYKDPDHSGNSEWAVHTHLSPTDALYSTPLVTRNDVFEAGRLVGIPQLDFAGITADLSQMKSDAQSKGKYLSNSGELGYHIVLKTNDTYDLYKINTLEDLPNGCVEVQGQQGWGSWSIKKETYVDNYSFPSNGLIFVEDNVWVDGQINTARVTIASARFPDNSSKRTSITVNNNLLYTNYDGRDVIGLIAQNNVNVGLKSADTLRIDAALIAQNGRVGRFYFRPPGSNQDRCSPYHVRTKITLYGSLTTAERYGFAYTDGTGYQTREIIYDGYLLYAPPPSFPLTSDQYSIISWEEIK